ncbi:MAG: lamin tail domain-containing protein, partial [Thermoplasmatales archaeon]|nr:lamin tail domain-containing protein [Thermoplasmatales archaeon]
IMYDPEPNDNYNEWIELYNPTNQSINVSDWTITDNSAEDFLEGNFDHGNGTTIIPPNGYAIITDHGTKIYETLSIPNNTIRLYVDDSGIGNGLGNNGDKLIIKNNTGETIDAVEWIINYTDVPGMPADPVEESYSLSRYQNIDTNDSSRDFYEGVNPTPGGENTFVQESNLDIILYPMYIPKIQNNSEYSLPFAIKLNMSNYSPNETYKLKSYVVGNLSSSWPASQTWNGNSWTYSNYYTSVINTDNYGNWSGWQYIRFKRDYKEYERNIKENNTAYLKVKIKKDNSTEEVSKNVYLLDMDNSTSNGTAGGCTVGITNENNTFLEEKTAIVENKSGITTGIYVTENNEIDEDLVSKPGYYKLTSPAGSEYIIKFLDDNESTIHTIHNVTIRQGKYGIDINSNETFYLVRKSETLDIPLTVKNTGDFNDTIDVSILHVTEGWHATLEKETIDVNLHITPCQKHGCISGTVTIVAVSENDAGEFDEITFQLEILAPDLTIKNIKIYNEEGEKSNIFGGGEVVKIKAFFKNLGNDNATDANVKFYYDYVDKEFFIGNKSYESIGKYQKYPSVMWDTKNVESGNHTIFVVADEEKRIDELDEYNNQLSVEVCIHDTHPSKTGESILITELYYYTHTRVDNEYIAICNPNSESSNIAGWYITNKPLKTKTTQTKIVFPNDTIIPPETCLYLTQNASAYTWETGKKPDFEYKADLDPDIPQMHTSKKFTLSNKGGIVVLKDCYNHTIDVVVYGESNYNFSGWNGTPVPDSGRGALLKRNLDEKGIPVDTNTSKDWLHPKRYGIGQSDFPYVNIPFYGEISTFVSPDCSFEVIVSELRKANDSIYFNIYEFTNPFLCNELIEALLRDVSVNIFLEGSPVGGISDKEKYILNRIASYGGNIRFIVNDQKNNVYARYIFDHGKYLVIDNKTVIVKSCNWAKTGIPKDPTYGNREWGIIVRNSDVAEYFLDVFLDDWNPKRCDSYSFEEVDLSVSHDFYMDESVYKGYYEPQFESKSFIGYFSAIPVFSPDTSYKAICNMIDSASESIYIEQLYIYRDWKNGISPFVERLVKKSNQGVDVKVILNHNPRYEGSNEKSNLTKQYFEEYGIEVKFIYTNWSYFSNVHNKGMIVDNRSVLISSINWNENSVTRNREAGIIIENEDVAQFYADVFFYDWNINSPNSQKYEIEELSTEESYKNTIYIVVIFTMTFALIARDWRKRQWQM